MKVNLRAIAAATIAFTITAAGLAGVSSRAGAGTGGVDAVAADVAPAAQLGVRLVLFQVRHSGMCMEQLVGIALLVEQVSCDDVKRQQQWWLQPTDADDGFQWYQFVNPYYGYCLDITGASQQIGADAQGYQCNGAYAQQFRLEPALDGYVKIIARHSGMCLEVTGASQYNHAVIQQNACTLASHRQWIQHKTVWYYQIRVRHSGRCLTRGTYDQVWQQFCESDNPTMRWRAVLIDSVYYYFINMQTGQCLDIKGASQEIGADAQTYQCNGTHAQQFYIPFLPGQATWRMFDARHSNKCLETTNGSFSDFTLIQQNVCTDTDYREWRFQ